MIPKAFIAKVQQLADILNADGVGNPPPASGVEFASFFSADKANGDLLVQLNFNIPLLVNEAGEPLNIVTQSGHFFTTIRGLGAMLIDYANVRIATIDVTASTERILNDQDDNQGDSPT